ncbi:MAG: anti-sigma factor antagonist [Desulfovibrio sp.]|nr:MAG: anti-sigma factor antagonist [Desulfovibrio sp.]
MEFESQKQGNSTVIKVTGRMDAVTAPEFEEKSGEIMEAGNTDFIVDFGSLEYISSAGLRSVLSVAKKLKAKQGGIRFCNLDGMVQEVFSVSGFSSMFPIFDTLEDALAEG